MKVKCIKIINSMTGESETINNWLTIGKTYTVLTMSFGIMTSVEKILYLSCQSDDNLTPILFNADQFVTVDDKIPSNWAVLLDESGNLNMAPRKWLRPGFWEDYFNFDPEAERHFESELAKIIEES